MTIARGPEGVFSEYDLTKKQADAVFLKTSGPGIHVEFKNTKIGQLKGKYSKNWTVMNQYSEEIFHMKDHQLLEHELQFKSANLKTVGDMWNYTLTQAQENRELLLQKHKGKEFISYAVHRIGSKKLIWKRI